MNHFGPIERPREIEKNRQDCIQERPNKRFIVSPTPIHLPLVSASLAGTWQGTACDSPRPPAPPPRPSFPSYLTIPSRVDRSKFPVITYKITPFTACCREANATFLLPIFFLLVIINYPSPTFPAKTCSDCCWVRIFFPFYLPPVPHPPITAANPLLKCDTEEPLVVPQLCIFSSTGFLLERRSQTGFSRISKQPGFFNTPPDTSL